MCWLGNAQAWSLTVEQDVRAGEELFHIPLALAISEKEMSDEHSASVIPHMAEVHPHTFLAAKCLREMASGASPWQPYFQACPAAGHHLVFMASGVLQKGACIIQQDGWSSAGLA